MDVIGVVVQQQPERANQQTHREQIEEPVPQLDAWYLDLLATLCSRCHRIYILLCRSSFVGKLEALFHILCIPCIVVVKAVNQQRVNLRQSGVVYLNIFLSITVVVNLVVPLKSVTVPYAENIQQYFVLGCIVLALVKMFYLRLFTRETLRYRELTLRAGYPPEALMRVFYQGGLYIFGFLSFGYSLGIAIDNITCGKRVGATVNVMKALYIVLQIIFLRKFYKARIPDNTPFIQVVMAHLLGTNLALWFWTLCSEEVSELAACTSDPFPLRNAEKYFSPLFVEYLLIAASLFYQMWKDLLPTQADDGEADRRRDETHGEDGIRADVSNRSGYGITVGCCFGVVFILLVIASAATGKTHQIYHVAYSGGIITLYITQIFACYIILLSAQSLDWDAQRTSLDHDDALLYITLVGSLLWEGFHLYSLVLIDSKPSIEQGSDRSVAATKVRNIDIAADLLAMLEYVLQTTTLINLLRHQPTRGRRTTWISQCVLFLFTANIGLWIENSFFVEILITTPGEKYTSIQKNLKPIGYILHPLNIFFRFHSAVCCLIAWSIFRN